MRNVRKRAEGRPRPAARISRTPRPAALARAACFALLTPPSRLFALTRRLKTLLHSLGLCPTCRPGGPGTVTVGVGGMSAEARGRVLLTSWLLGWAKARGVGAAVVAPVGDGHPAVLPHQVTPGGDPEDSGIEAALLAGYAPHVRLLLDTDPVRAAKTAVRAFAPGMLVLQDALADPRLARNIELALLTAEDLGPGWDRVFPAGRWRRDASALARASAFCVFTGPLGLAAAMDAAERRLGKFGKPIFSLTFDIWRWSGPETVVRAEELVGKPYIAVLGESDRDILPEMLRRQLEAAPRMAFFVHDSHRFTRQDFENLRADAVRLKAKNILTSPRLALKLRPGGAALDGLAVWTYDPEVVFGPAHDTGVPFLTWWETAYQAAKTPPKP